MYIALCVQHALCVYKVCKCNLFLCSHLSQYSTDSLLPVLLADKGKTSWLAVLQVPSA